MARGQPAADSVKSDTEPGRAPVDQSEDLVFEGVRLGPFQRMCSMSSFILPESSGNTVTPESPSDLKQDQTPAVGTRTALWFFALLLITAGVLGLVGTEPRSAVQALRMLDPSVASDRFAALEAGTAPSGLPQIEGVVRRSLSQSAPSDGAAVLRGQALGQGSDPRALRKPVAVNLTQEQTLLARHIATEYRRALDFSRELVHHVYQVAREAQVDPLLVLAIVSVESRFNPLAESPAGAQGLMQVLTRVHFAKFRPFGGIQAAFDPVANLKVGTAILRHYLHSQDTVALALKAYVGAAQADHDFGYGAKVMAARAQLAEVAGINADTAQNSASVRMVPVVDRASAPDPQDDI